MNHLLEISSPIQFDQLLSRIWDLLPQLLFTLVILAAGTLLIRFALSLVGKGLVRSKIDATLHPFIRTTIRIALWVVLGIICMEMLNIPTAPVIASFSAVGLALSLAAKDSLSNVAGGLMLLVSKPFAAGDYVQIDSLEGTVAEVGFVHTALTTVDNKRITIPNSDVTTSRIINYSSEPYRRLDVTFSIGYGDDFDLAQQLLLDIIQNSGMAEATPAPAVRMNNHGADAIEIICKVWVKGSAYWDLKYYLNEEVKRQFDQHQLNIPYRQLDVHLHS